MKEGSLSHWLLAGGFFFVLAVIETWPLALQMDDHIMGWAPDSYQVMWNLWWVKEQILSLENPFRTEALFYPQGSDLYMHTLTPVNGVLSIPLQLLTGNVLLSWNILSLAFFTASALGAYALAYHVSRDPWASLIGGVIFAFSPFVMVHVHGHLNIATTWPIPLFVLSVLRYSETRRTRWAALAGVLWAIMTWNWLEFAIDSGLFLMLFFAFWGFLYYRRRDGAQLRGLLRGGAVIAAVWLVLSLPYLVPATLEVASGDISTHGGLSPPAEYYSADLLAYITPSALWGPGEFPKGDSGYPTAIGGVEGTVFLGILPLLLSAAAIIYYFRTDRRTVVVFWAGVFAFFAIMALGPYLYVGGDKTFDLGFWEFSVSLPFRLFKELPLIGLRRAPARMVVYATLALAVLAPLGLSVLARGLSGGSAAIARGAVLVALALVLLETWNPPVSTATYQLPAIYEQIAREPGDFTLLELPVGRITGTVQRGDIIGGGMTNYSQITHGKASIGGYFSRGKEKDIAWLRTEPGIGYLSCPVCPEFLRPEDLDRELLRRVFADLHIKYVIVNLETFEGEPTAYVTDGTVEDVRAYIEDVLAFEPAGSGEGWFAYRNPDVN